MNRNFILIIFTLFTSYSIAQQYAAGVLPYCIGEDNEIYLLLGKESSNSYWNDFIGKYEGFDAGDLINTAAREFHQETNCYFKIGEIRNKIYNNRNNVIEIKKHVYRFIIEFPNIDPLEISKNPLPCIEYVEKSDWKWVKLSEVEKAINLSKSDKDVNVYYGNTNEYITLDKQMKKGLLPDSKTIEFFNDIKNQL